MRGGWEREVLGGALASILIVLPVVLIGVAAYSERALIEMEGALQQSHRARSHYIAHAALQKAVRAYLDDANYRGMAYHEPFAGGTYTYQVEGSEVHPVLGQRIRITAEGTLNDPATGATQKEMSVILRRFLGRSVLDYAMAAGARVALNGGAQIGDPMNTDNKVYANTTDPTMEHLAIYGQGSTWIYGQGEVATMVTQSNPPNMDPGPITYGVRPLDFPTYDVDALRVKAQNNMKNPQFPGGAYFTGDVIFENETVRGVVFVEGGAVDIKGTVVVEGCIIQVGPRPVTVNADLFLRSDMDPVTGAPHIGIVKLGGDILKFSAAKSVDIEGFILSDSQIIFDSDGVVRGGLISPEALELGGNCTVYFHNVKADEIAKEVSVPGEWYVDVVSWTEQQPRKVPSDTVPLPPPDPLPQDPPEDPQSL